MIPMRARGLHITDKTPRETVQAVCCVLMEMHDQALEQAQVYFRRHKDTKAACWRDQAEWLEKRAEALAQEYSMWTGDVSLHMDRT